MPQAWEGVGGSLDSLFSELFFSHVSHQCSYKNEPNSDEQLAMNMTSMTLSQLQNSEQMTQLLTNIT